MSTLASYYNFREHFPYRLAYHLDNKKLQGKPVIFRGWHKAPWDVERAVVCLMNDDGSCGEEYLVWPTIILPI